MNRKEDEEERPWIILKIRYSTSHEKSFKIIELPMADAKLVYNQFIQDQIEVESEEEIKKRKKKSIYWLPFIFLNLETILVV